MEKKKSKLIFKVFKIIIFAILIALLITNIFIIVQANTSPDKVPNLFGYKPFIVLSGSMESEINVGDLVVVKNVDRTTLQIGDVIAFRDNEDLVTTHRITDIIKTEDKTYFETKGDNNNTKDEGLVSADNVEGKYQTKFSGIGNVILFIQQPTGFVIMMMAILMVCIFIFFIENKKINKEADILDEKERKEFEEFKKQKQMQNQKEQ